MMTLGHGCLETQHYAIYSACHLESASNIGDYESKDDSEAMVKLRKLPTNVIALSHWAFEADGIPLLYPNKVGTDLDVFLHQGFPIKPLTTTPS